MTKPPVYQIKPEITAHPEYQELERQGYVAIGIYGYDLVMMQRGRDMALYCSVHRKNLIKGLEKKLEEKKDERK